MNAKNEMGVLYKAVIAAGIANWALSVAWYSVFGRTWAELTGTSPEWEFEVGKVLLGLGFNFLMALGVGVVLMPAKAENAMAGFRWGLLLALLVVLPAHSGKWTWQDKPMLLAIDAGGHLISLVASGVIIGAWSGRFRRRERARGQES